MSARPYGVYAALDSEGRVIYVGRSVNPKVRRRQHELHSTWAEHATRWTILGSFDDWVELIGYERTALRRYKPVFNMVGAAPDGNYPLQHRRRLAYEARHPSRVEPPATLEEALKRAWASARRTRRTQGVTS